MKKKHKKYISENINKKSVNKISQELNLKERSVRKILEKEVKKKRKMDSGKERKEPIKKRTVFISIAIIISLGFLVYGNSVNGKFLWDDHALIKDNAYITSWSNIPKVFTKNKIGGSDKQRPSFYRPLQIITYMIDYSLWKLDERGYHFTNILLHILVALAIYWLIVTLYGDSLLTLFTSILFVVHPIHTEAVAYISGRADPLAAAFMLLCFIFYIKYLHTENIKSYVIVLLSYIFALLSRENSLILPVLLLLYHYTFKEKLKIKGFLPIAGITFIYISLRFTTLKFLLSDTSFTAILFRNTTLFQRMPGFFAAIINYINLLFLPFNLHMEYGYRSFNFNHPTVLLGIVASLLLLIYTFRKRDVNRLIFFSVSWFFVALLPQSNLYPINAYMAEHWLYLPSIGFFLILAYGLNSLQRIKNLRIFTFVFIISLLTFYSYLTIRQNNYWRDPIAFYERNLKYTPDSERLHDNLGDAYLAAGKNVEAIASYKKAIRLNPNHADACSKLGYAYLAIGKNEEAAALFKETIKLNPSHADAYNSLGYTYLIMGKGEEEVIPLFKKAIKLNPNHANAYNNLGNACLAIGKNKEAIALFKKVIELNPDHATGHNNLAMAYYREKEYDLAIKHCEKAIKLGSKVHPELLALLNSFHKRGFQ